MSTLTVEEVERIADIARLKLTDAEASAITEQLKQLIQFAEQLEQIETENIEPTARLNDVKNVLRKDEKRTWITREEALKNTSEQMDGQMKVPAILD